MKKILLIAAILFLAVTIEAIAGEYDGFWVTQASPDDFFFLRHTTGFLVIVRLTSDLWWEAFGGPISGNSAVVSTLVSIVNVNATVTFNSATSGKVRINHCVPTQDCLFPGGTVFQIEKIF